MDDAAARIEELRRRIADLNHAYHVLAEPRASDAEYDELFRELQRLEEEHPELDSDDSPTRRVGAPPLSAFTTVEHGEPMLSLANALNDEDIIEFHERILKELDEEAITWSIEPKVDGIGLSLTYVKGALVLAATRGDGTNGEDVTANARTISSIPLRLREGPIPDLIEIRGEVFCEVARFEEFNAGRSEEEGRYANPRNFTSGSLRQLDSKITAQRPLDALFYAYGKVEGLEITSHRHLVELLEGWGFRTAARWMTHSDDITAIVDHHHGLENGRDEVPFEIDGTVIKVDDIERRRILGFRTRTPRWAVAAKFKSRQASTRLLDIEISVGRTGALTPVAVLEPVPIGGVTVSSASLHNADEIARLDARVGDRVLVERAGDVIPKVVKVLTAERTGEEKPFAMPTACPECGTAAGRDDDGVIVRCPNLDCPARLRGDVSHLASKDALDIEGLGSKLVEQLVEKGHVRSVVDLFALDAETLTSLERMGETSSNNLLAAIEKAKSPTLSRFIYALGIRHVGERVADVIASHTGSVEKLLEATQEDLEAIHEIGEKAAAAVVEYTASERGRGIISGLVAAGLSPRAEAKRGGGALSGKTFVITGTLPEMSRKDAENFIKLHGGKPVSSVSKTTSYLVAGEKAGSKLKKAEQHGIEILDEAGLRALVE